MINKRQILLTKIDLLHISLEAIVHSYTTNKKLTDFVLIHEMLRKQENSKLYHFITLLQYIKQLQIITEEYSINKIATKILKEYTNNSMHWAASKYNNKFSSIYNQNKKKNYYKNTKLLYNTYQINTKEISILNLYIFTKITRKDGTFTLIKYFYK